MKAYDYVLVGGGMAAEAAVQGIRRRDRQGSILMVSEELFPPYARPPLSKRLWMDERMEEIWLPGWQRHANVELLLNTRITRISRDSQVVDTAEGRQFAYGKLLLATGGHPRVIPGSSERVYYVGSLGEHIRLWKAVREPSQLLVVGGGFIGAEMAAVLSSQGHRVQWVIAEKEPFAGFFPPTLRERVASEYRGHGVSITTGELVSRFESGADGVTALFESGRQATAQAAVVGIGLALNDGLGIDASLSEGPGIVVDDGLRTVDPYIWAAGDVAVMRTAPHPMLHEDHAVTQGRMAGENMAGAQKRYTHVPFFYSDLYQFGYEAIGDCRTDLEMVEDWVNPGEEGVVYYLRQGQVVGVLNWNVWDGIPKARELLGAEKVWRPEELRGQIRNQGE